MLSHYCHYEPEDVADKCWSVTAEILGRGGVWHRSRDSVTASHGSGKLKPNVVTAGARHNLARYQILDMTSRARAGLGTVTRATCHHNYSGDQSLHPSILRPG